MYILFIDLFFSFYFIFVQPIGPKCSQLSELWAVKKKILKYFQVWKITRKVRNVVGFCPKCQYARRHCLVELRMFSTCLLPFSLDPSTSRLNSFQVCNHVHVHIQHNPIMFIRLINQQCLSLWFHLARWWFAWRGHTCFTFHCGFTSIVISCPSQINRWSK